MNIELKENVKKEEAEELINLLQKNFIPATLQKTETSYTIIVPDEHREKAILILQFPKEHCDEDDDISRFYGR